jgi:hypothetical protein
MIGLLLRGSGALNSPAARWAVSLLAVAGAALLVWSCAIHLMLWTDGYRYISVVGPLFLIQGVGGILIAVLMAFLRWLALIAAAAVTLVATAVGLLLSVYISLFGYRESLAVPYAKLSLTIEFSGAALLVLAAAVLLAAPAGSARPPRHRKQSITVRRPYL